MKTYYIIAVQCPGKGPVVYTTETHKPRNNYEAKMSPAKYTQAWVATTVYTAHAVYTCSAKNRDDALRLFLESRK